MPPLFASFSGTRRGMRIDRGKAECPFCPLYSAKLHNLFGRGSLGWADGTRSVPATGGGATQTQLVLTNWGELWQTSTMPRRARVTPGGLVYHVLDRTVAGLPLFPGHFVVWPRHEGALVNEPMTEKEAGGLQICIARNRPYGDERWQEVQPERRGLTHTLRNEGRPKAVTNASEG